MSMELTMKILQVSIKKKLYITYMLGILLTLLLMLLVSFLAHGNRFASQNSEVDGQSGPENIMSYALQFNQLNSVELASRSINIASNNLNDLGDKTFMLDESFWFEADKSLKRNVSLLVFKDGNVLFESSKLPADIDYSSFPAYGEVKSFPNEYLFSEFQTSVQRQVDYQAPSGEKVTVFIMFSVGSPTSKTFIIILNNIMIFMVISTTIMGIISWFVVRSITDPLDELKNAVDQVRKGNLEHEVKYTTNDKIGKLSEAFEAMRMQLLEKENIREQYEANRRQMISSISHDLRTPVTAIQLHAEGIMDGVASSPEKQNKYLKSMSNNAKTIDRLLKELTLFSNLDAEQETFQFSSIDLHRFIDDLVEEWKYDYAKDNVDFNLVMDRNKSVLVKLDVIHFRRVLVNIVENSVKYVDIRPLKLKVSTEVHEGYYRIILLDNGPGVPSDQLETIFERFHRVDQARQSSVPGSGLGLSIARQIVLKHSGKIWADQSLEEGLSVCIDLPIVEEDNHG